MPSCNTCMIHTKSPGAFHALWHTPAHHLDVSPRRNVDGEWHAYIGVRSPYTYKWTTYRLPTSWHQRTTSSSPRVSSLPRPEPSSQCRAERRRTATLQPATLTVTLGPTLTPAPRPGNESTWQARRSLPQAALAQSSAAGQSVHEPAGTVTVCKAGAAAGLTWGQHRKTPPPGSATACTCGTLTHSPMLDLWYNTASCTVNIKAAVDEEQPD